MYKTVDILYDDNKMFTKNWSAHVIQYHQPCVHFNSYVTLGVHCVHNIRCTLNPDKKYKSVYSEIPGNPSFVHDAMQHAEKVG